MPPGVPPVDAALVVQNVEVRQVELLPEGLGSRPLDEDRVEVDLHDRLGAVWLVESLGRVGLGLDLGLGLGLALLLLVAMPSFA